jgi:hypothetical protein
VAEPEWLSPQEACFILRCESWLLRGLAEAGILHANRLPSGHRRYPAAEIAALKALRDAGGSGG